MSLPDKQSLKGAPINSMVVGVPFKAMMMIVANVADGETVTLGSDVYEFDSAVVPTITAGRIRVDVTAGLTPAVAIPAFVTAVNTRNQIFKALALDAATILITGKVAAKKGYALSETMAGAGNIIDAVTYGGAGSTGSVVHTFSFTPTANEVTAGLMAIPLDKVPTEAIVKVRDASGGIKAWDGVVSIDATNKLVKLDNSGTVDWTATDKVNVLVF